MKDRQLLALSDFYSKYNKVGEGAKEGMGRLWPLSN